ncbi:MAG: DUF655 domain-containing protein, partial [Haloferacaceae archaeon]
MEPTDSGSPDPTPDPDDASAKSAKGPEEGADAVYAVVLDYYPHGRREDSRPQFEKSPVAQAIDEKQFRLFEFTLSEDPDLNITDRVRIEPEPDERITRLREIEYGDLSSNATSELEYAVEEIVERDERRFVDFYNEAQPITLRLHQLN